MIRKRGLQLLIAIASAWLLLVIVVKGTDFWETYRAQQLAETFFDRLTAGQYEEASVLWARSEPQEWRQLSQELHARGVYAADYSRLQAVFDDGCACTGRALLTLMENGAERTYDAIFTFAKTADGQAGIGQVCTLPKEEPGPAHAAWRKLNCGSGS